MLLAVLGIEVALLAAVTGWWLGLATDAPDGAPRYGLIALAGATMGAQSAMTRAIGVPVATTYITGTWTTVSAAAGALLRRRATGEPGPPERTLTLQALVVAVYLVTAAGAALAYRFLGAAVTALPLGMLALVAVAALRRSGVIGRRPDAERR
jgi:uncharacterized membrane protein YoaK (UPF0700 family)